MREKSGNFEGNFEAEEGWSLARLIRDINRKGYRDKDVAKGYRRFIESDPARMKEIEQIIEQLPEIFEIRQAQKIERMELPEITAVDLGAGSGVATEQLLKRKVKRVIAVDQSAEMLREHKRQSEAENVEYVQADINKLPLADESVEAVVSTGTVFEIRPGQDEQFLSEVMRILKRGGVALIDGISNSARINKEEFERKFQEESDYARKNENKPVTQRFQVFLDSQLPEKINALGYDCEIESLLNGKKNEYCIVRITKK